MRKTIEELENERWVWSLKTFPEATATSSLMKLIDELNEVRDAIAKRKSQAEIAEEYADLIMCAFDSAARQGILIGDLRDAFEKKLSINKERKWEKNANNTYSHIRQLDTTELTAEHTTEYTADNTNNLQKGENSHE
jgi:NTP pyrophosphatase (non-canonical NTP hydrolase)